MKQTKNEGVFQRGDKLYTENPESCRGIRVYNEKLVHHSGREYRSWNPYRSKLAAVILNGLNINIKSNSKILYLGAATGTTVSHISDIVKKGLIYAVENSPISMKNLIQVSEKRQNIIPILADANHPDRYETYISDVDIVYQDISQRNQAEIFIKNTKRYLKDKGQGILMVKARSIDVSLKPEKAYEKISKELKENQIKTIDIKNLSPYQKDHAAISISL